MFVCVFFVSPRHILLVFFSARDGTLTLGRPSPREITTGPYPEPDESSALPHHISLR